jgi:hypothetical protein
MRAFWRIDIDLDKHLTTLSTASIVGLAALLQVSPLELQLGRPVAFSFMLLLATIILSVSSMWFAQLRLLDMPTGVLSGDFTSLRSGLPRKILALFFRLHWAIRAASSSTFIAALAIVAWTTLQV